MRNKESFKRLSFSRSHFSSLILFKVLHDFQIAGERVVLINFAADIVNLTAAKQIEKVSKDWFSKVEI